MAKKKEDAQSVYLKRLKKIFKNIPDSKRKASEELICNAAFMEEQLAELQENIRQNGCVEEYRNGATQFGYKKSVHVDVYNTMIKNYNTVIKQLLDLLPEADKEENDELMAFLAVGGKK